MICRRYAKKLECSEVDLTMVLSAPLGVSNSRCPKKGGASMPYTSAKIMMPWAECRMVVTSSAHAPQEHARSRCFES
jgi:hypothetical protein